jgi:hypothetical protein
MSKRINPVFGTAKVGEKQRKAKLPSELIIERNRVMGVEN